MKALNSRGFWGQSRLNFGAALAVNHTITVSQYLFNSFSYDVFSIEASKCILLETNADTIHQSQLIEHAKELELWMQNLLMKALFVLITLPFFVPIFCSIENSLMILMHPKLTLSTILILILRIWSSILMTPLMKCIRQYQYSKIDISWLL